MDNQWEMNERARQSDRITGSGEPGNGSPEEPQTLPAEPLRHATTTTSDETPRPPSPVEEDIVQPTRFLNQWDVASLIINKMIGSGIFTAPPTVLVMTRSPGLALGLWIIGFAYTLTSMLVYLEYARKLPHTGGELIYLDETLPGPDMLPYTLYMFYFVILYNTATNCMRFADYVLQCAGTVEDERLLRFIAVMVLTFFCILHFRSARMARRLNKGLAGLKVVMLLVVFVAGAIKASQHKTSWSESPSDESSSSAASSSAAAFLLVLFSYQGWENANFVTGEVRSHETLKWGFITGVLTVGTLYLLVNIVFLSAIAYSPSLTGYVALFFGNSTGAQQAWDVIIAISAAGSLLSVIYTCARVKQAIGKSNSIPWSRVWSLESPYKTPEGGLLLHWIFSVILIAVTAAIPDLSEAISFPGNLQAYGTGFIGVLIAIGFPFLDRKDIPEPTRGPGEIDWCTRAGFFNTRKRRYILSAVYMLFNGYVVIVNIIPPYQNPDGSTREIKGWVYLVIVSGTVATGLLYYYLAFRSSRISVVRLAKATAEIEVEPTHHRIYGCRKYVKVTPHDLRHPSFLYRLFGGHLTGDEDYPEYA